MTQVLDRRRALAVVAAIPAAAALSVPAFASVDKDAELLQLWEEWKEQFARVGTAWKAEDEASAKASEDSGPIWQLIDVKISPSRAFFLSSWANDDRIKIVRLKTKSFDKAQDEARKVEASLKVERHVKRIAADRKHMVASFKRAHESANRKLDQIEAAIAEAPTRTKSISARPLPSGTT